MRRPDQYLFGKVQEFIGNTAYSYLAKYGEVPVSTGPRGYRGQVEPPYQRVFDPRWIYRIRKNSALINNSIEEKVNQTFRRGWTEWQKAYEAKCPECDKEYSSEAPFVEDYHPDDVDIDFSKPRECPECDEKVEFITPNPEELERAKNFFEDANGHNLDAPHLEPSGANSVSQSFIEVLREAAWDVESFDDEWLVFSRSYSLDPETGAILDYELEGVYRSPPEKMRYVVDKDDGTFGGEYWVCVECRERQRRKGEVYSPETEDQRCTSCGNLTYAAYAIATEGARGEDPVQYYIRGEFAHRSMYEPGRFYGYPPIVTLWEEARTLEQMDEWYQEAYEQRRAPRAAIAIKSSNSQSTRDWNKKQFEKLKGDPNHIPTLMDDGDSDGDPISFISLLESPAEMQHMEMRNWFKERISAKWGVMPIFQGQPSDSGLSQSLEVKVSTRAADRLRKIQNELVDIVLEQLEVEGWTIEIAPVEEEDEQEVAQLTLKHLQAAQQAASLGLDVEWTEENRAHIKAGDVEAPEEGGEEGMGMGGMDGLGELGSEGEETAADQGGPGDQEDVQTATESAGGERVDLGDATTGASGPE